MRAEANILALRVVVYGNEPEYASEDAITSALWDSRSSDCAACQIAISSFGNLQLVRRKSTVATVHMGRGASEEARAALPLLDDCMTWEIATLALDAARRELNVDPRSYDFAALFLPYGSNCSFAGRAIVGCDIQPCLTWYRVLSPITLLHEIGHNLGLEHSGVDPNDDPKSESGERSYYGDPTTAMGHTSTFVGFNAAEKLQVCSQ